MHQPQDIPEVVSLRTVRGEQKIAVNEAEKRFRVLLGLYRSYRLEDELGYQCGRYHALTAYQRTAYTSRNEAVYQDIGRASGELAYPDEVRLKRRHELVFFVQKITPNEVCPENPG